VACPDEINAQVPGGEADKKTGESYMGSISSTGISAASLLQSLTNGSPQFSATLSSPTVQTALQNATAGELVELSTQALQLQESDLLFGDSTAAASGTLASTLASLSSPPSSDATSVSAASDSSSSASTSASPPTSASSQLATYQTELQSQELEALFGVGSNNPSTSLIDTIG
jgi:hypothetical protein